MFYFILFEQKNDFFAETLYYQNIKYNISAATYTNVASGASISEAQDLTHSIARISTFKFTPITSVINYDPAGTHIADISVLNNTRDGYSLSVTSTKGGVLSPSATDDGEADIQYGLAFTYSGEASTEVTQVASLASSTLGSQVAILSLPTNGTQSGPTDLNINVDVVFALDVSDQMAMAGTYSDTLTFTYTDI